MRKLAAIMFTDIAGYTALMSQDEEKALQLLQKNRALLKPIIEEFRGEWLKEMGDGTLSSFASAVDAVNCALEIQHIIRQDPELPLRIGIHIGDVVFERGDVFGDGVNVASRIEPLAEPGCICVTEQVYDAIRNRPAIETTSLGEQQLKGVDHPIRVYTITEQREDSLDAYYDLFDPEYRGVLFPRYLGGRDFLDSEVAAHHLKGSQKVETLDARLGKNVPRFRKAVENHYLMACNNARKALVLLAGGQGPSGAGVLPVFGGL